MVRDIVIASAVRTPIGKFGGTLAEVSAAKLGEIVIKEALIRANIHPDEVDEVLIGCVLQSAQGQNVARQAAIGAGLSVDIPAMTVNNVCGSGLKTINMAASEIMCGNAEIIVAGGTENMSRIPYVLEKARSGYRMGNGELIDLMLKDALTDAFDGFHMGITAENLAERYKLSREMQDEFAASSQQKCEVAQKAGKFIDEIVPVPITVKKETVMFEIDEYPRGGVTAESLNTMRPAFKKDGTVTAANASGINDGAAAVVVMSAEAAKRLNVKPMAHWVGGAWAGVEPEIMGIGPVASSRRLLEKTNLVINDMKLIEANEAFAAQALAVGAELKWDANRVNVNGGAIALGHPVGASGCRILVTLLHELRRQGGGKGLATLCVGGGMGVSAIVEVL